MHDTGVENSNKLNAFWFYLEGIYNVYLYNYIDFESTEG